MAESSERKSGGLQLEAHQVLLRPLITEKGMHQVTRHNSYTFEINQAADKEQVKAAVQEMFGVRVLRVRTQTRLGKKRRFRFRQGRLANWKKAIVTLHDEDKIEFF